MKYKTLEIVPFAKTLRTFLYVLFEVVLIISLGLVLTSHQAVALKLITFDFIVLFTAILISM